MEIIQKSLWHTQFAGWVAEIEGVSVVLCTSPCVCVGRDYGEIYLNLLILLCHGSTPFLTKARLALVFALRSIAG